MLRELLMEIQNSNYISKANMAVKFNKPVELIEDGFEQLIRMGYISEDHNLNNCNSYCGNCPYSKSCNKMPVKTIKITEKGERYLAG